MQEPAQIGTCRHGTADTAFGIEKRLRGEAAELEAAAEAFDRDSPLAGERRVALDGLSDALARLVPCHVVVEFDEDEENGLLQGLIHPEHSVRRGAGAAKAIEHEVTGLDHHPHQVGNDLGVLRKRKRPRAKDRFDLQRGRSPVLVEHAHHRLFVDLEQVALAV